MIQLNKMNVNILLLFVVFIFSKYCFSQTQTPTIRGSRPRVLLSEDRFNILKTYYENPSNERLNTLFDKIGYHNSTIYNFYFRGKPQEEQGTGINLTGREANWIWNWESPGNALNTLRLITLYYHLGIEENTQIRRIKFITKEFIEFINLKHLNGQSVIDHIPEGLDRYSNGYEDKLRQIADFGSVLLDWGYDMIDHNDIDPKDPNSTRKQLVDLLWEVNLSFLQVFVYHKDNKDPDPRINYSNYEYLGGHSLFNHVQNAKLVISLQHSEELTSDQEFSLDVRFRVLYNNLVNEFIPLFKYYMDDNGDGLYGENEGGDENGATYSQVRSKGFIEFFDLIYVSTGNNIYSKNGWINNYINQFSSLLRPDKSTLHLGDDLIIFSKQYRSTVLSLSNHFNLDKNKWMLHEYVNNSSYYHKTVEELFFRNNFSEANAPVTNPFPLEWFSKKTGHSIMKSSQGESGTMISYVNRPINKNNHQHLDNNSFTIYKNGPLFIDAGVYDSYFSSHRKNFYSRTIAHNAITVHDPNENFGTNISNDGGQLVSKNLINFEEVSNEYSDDSWKQYSKTDDFVYHVTDASSSYNKNKVESYIRKFLYIKSDDRAIIIDYIKQPDLNQKLEVRWNAHFKNKPEVYNIHETKEAPYSTAIVAGDSIMIERYKYDPKYKVSNSGGGNATIKTLFPIASNNETKLIGSNVPDLDRGCYYIYQGNDEEGENYQPDYEKEGENVTDGAKWRLEVSSINNNKYNILLNTIDIGDTIKLSKNESTLLSNEGYSMAIRWDSNLYVFGKNYFGNNNIDHFINLKDLDNNKKYNLKIFDLEPNTDYKVRIDIGTKIDRIRSNVDGIIEASIDYWSGNYMHIEPLPGAFQSKSVSKKLEVYPNILQSGDDLTISMGGYGKEIVINNLYLYDLQGELVFHKEFFQNELLIKNFKLPKGIYLVKVVNQERVLTKKLVVNE